AQRQEHVLERGAQVEGLHDLQLLLHHLAVVGAGGGEVELGAAGPRAQRHAGLEVDERRSDEAGDLAGDLLEPILDLLLGGHGSSFVRPGVFSDQLMTRSFSIWRSWWRAMARLALVLSSTR